MTHLAILLAFLLSRKKMSRLFAVPASLRASIHRDRGIAPDGDFAFPAHPAILSTFLLFRKKMPPVLLSCPRPGRRPLSPRTSVGSRLGQPTRDKRAESGPTGVTHERVGVRAIALPGRSRYGRTRARNESEGTAWNSRRILEATALESLPPNRRGDLS